MEGAEAGPFALQAEGNGYFSALLPVGAGTLYRYRLDGTGSGFPDPASRFQPEGPFGPSEVIDPTTYPWTDHNWKGVSHEGRVIYELHIGTFTPEGTYRAAMEQLPRLADLGINVIEVMPLADFPGRFGWGYDGVNLYAPTRLYGRPDDFRAFVDRAHALGMGVILDVVYNHIGPSGNFLKEYSSSYFSTKHHTDWGEAINFDGADCEPVRDFFSSNAGHWIAEYHLDGLRLDATQNIYDDNPGEHILAAIGRVCRKAASGRAVILVAENEPQEARLLQSPEAGGFGLDMIWNDDWHHSARVAVTGRAEAYYKDYRGHPQELLSAVKYGFLYQGQYYSWQKQRRGTLAFDLPPASFVTFLDNHDQVSNAARGLHLHDLTSPGRYRAITAFLLLTPGTPMLFQGQEFACSSPFVYFADHDPDLAPLVHEGRIKFLTQFPSLVEPSNRPVMPKPHELESFQLCKLKLEEITTHAWAVALHRDLLKLRREDPVLARYCTQSKAMPRRIDGAILGPEALLLRFFADDPRQDRLLLLNLGVDLPCGHLPEPLLACPAGYRWLILWSSEDAVYGGCGTGKVELESTWILPGHSALLLVPGPG